MTLEIIGMKLGILFSIIATSFFMAFVVKRLGKLQSISSSIYEFRKRKLPNLFTWWVFIAGIPLMIDWFNLTVGLWYQFLVFFACGSLFFVGAASEYKESLTDKVHYISAGICVTAATLFVVLSGFWFIPAVFYAVAILLSIRDKCWLWWIEIAAFASTYLTLLII